MIRSTLSVSAGLALVAVIGASLWIGFGPRPQTIQDKRVSAAIPLSQQSRSGLDANGQAVRTIAPGPGSSSGTVGTAPTRSIPSVAPPSNQAAIPKASDNAASPERVPDSVPLVASKNEAAPTASNNQSATDGAGVDLNTATVEQLNALGAGMIGKRIIEFRPYGSPDELISRRVLKRADYDTIKAAVIVR